MEKPTVNSNGELPAISSKTIVAREQRCIIMRNGSEIWIPKDKADQLQNALINGDRGFVKLTDSNDRVINMVDITEFLSPDQMNERARIKAGEWKCDRGNWHKKNQSCECSKIEIQEFRKKQREIEDREKNRQITPEERKRSLEAIA